MDILPQVDAGYTWVAAFCGAEEQPPQAEGAGSVAAEPQVEAAAAVVANVDQPDLHSHNSHTKRSVRV